MASAPPQPSGVKVEKRLPVSIFVNLAPVVRLPADEAELTYTENVSDHGACVVSNHPWQCGEIAEITSLLDQISLRGQVVHCRQCGDERYAIGLRFRNAVVWPASVKLALKERGSTSKHRFPGKSYIVKALGEENAKLEKT